MATDKTLENILSPEGKIVQPPLEGGQASPENEARREKLPERDLVSEKSKAQASAREAFRDVLAKVKRQKTVVDVSEQAKEIDNILEEGLGDIFLKLDPAKQKEFKEEGEKAVVKIDRMLSQTKVSVHKIFQTIKRWLARIPGINRFFLEQEAKIKTDRIMKIKR